MTDSVTMHDRCLIQQVQCLGKAEYEIVRNSILKNLLAYGAMTSVRLRARVKDHLKHKLQDSLWDCFELVQQDLEVRGEIRVDRSLKSQLIEIAK
jgi:hypothetical protein